MKLDILELRKIRGKSKQKNDHFIIHIVFERIRV